MEKTKLLEGTAPSINLSNWQEKKKRKGSKKKEKDRGKKEKKARQKKVKMQYHMQYVNLSIQNSNIVAAPIFFRLKNHLEMRSITNGRIFLCQNSFD